METAPPHDICPITRTLDLIGERWSLLIIRDVFYGVRRFDALQHHLGVSKKVLSGRLVRLVQEGILKKVPYQQKPERFEYRLTQKGRDLFPVLLTMMRWGNRWLAEKNEPHLHLKHLGCGEVVESNLVCSHCEKPLSPASVRAEISNSSG